MTLSSSRCLGPALGNVALLNSAVFILCMKLEMNKDKNCYNIISDTFQKLLL